MAAILTLDYAVRGDNYSLLHPVTGLLAGVSVVSAACVVKTSATAPSPVLPAKNLTSSLVANVGQVINVSGTVPANNGGFASPATQPYILVLFTPAETRALTGTLPYTVVIQLTDSNGELYTSEISSWPIRAGLAG